ncbi:MAG TPA: hypothetical protein EYG66_06730 [Mariprofundaceae bacterium]|nr:hypothetical protein [Mariprofundaceae bacterium]
MASDVSWAKIFDDYAIHKHDFSKSPFDISAAQIKQACQGFRKTAEKEVRLLCKQDSRRDRPAVFIKNNLFLLPVKNGFYKIVQGEGYIDIPDISEDIKVYDSKLGFKLDSASVGDSEMQHLDFAYASSLIRTFMEDDSLVLTIRGRKYTPKFHFFVDKHRIDTESVQTEVDAGYEGKDKIVLIEAKNSKTKDSIIRQLFYPYKQWKTYTEKEVCLLFFEKRGDEFFIWQYGFTDEFDYNSIQLIKSARFTIHSLND